jgi:hypothetical protein
LLHSAACVQVATANNVSAANHRRGVPLHDGEETSANSDISRMTQQ